MGCGCSTDVTPSQLSQTNSVGEPNDVKVQEPSPRNCDQHEALLLAEAEDLLKRLPSNEAAAILATLLDSSTPVAVLMKEEVARQTPA